MSRFRPKPEPVKGHMPFPGHRTQKQVREDESRADAIIHALENAA